MNSSNFVYALVICAFFGYSYGADYMETKADFIKTCKMGLGFEACTIESMQGIYERFLAGPVDNVSVPIDPVKLKKLKIFSGDGPVSVNTTLSKAVITGLANTVFLRAVANPDFSASTYMRVPKVRIEGNYDMKGKVLLLPVVGRGKMWIEPHNLDIVVYNKAKIYEKYNHTFYNMTEIKVDFNITNLSMHFDNLFDGVKLLGDSTNAFLNENWKDVFEAFKPIISRTIENILIEMMNRIFNYIPLEFVITGIPPVSELYGKS